MMAGVTQQAEEEVAGHTVSEVKKQTDVNAYAQISFFFSCTLELNS